ncbi:MAG: hypothetical protein ACLFWL_12630 [Candidatus Brocadiia bacterium]
MFNKKYELVDRFLANSEDGRKFMLHVYEAIKHAHGLNQPAVRRVIRTTAGYHCESVDGNGTFEITSLGLQVKKV